MRLSLQNFSTLVQTGAAAVQASSRQLLDLSVGSVLRAILEANASVGLWMQWLIVQVLQPTRASTSTGADLDSWMADFSLTRLPAAAATGIVTFSRFTPLAPALVPAGALVRTSDGAQTYSVVIDTSLPGFSSDQNGYVLPSGVASLDIPVIATSAGSAGNVQAASVNLVATAIPGIDAVTNAVAFQNGLDAETDIAFRTRFANYLDSRSRATPAAIGYAIGSVQQGLQYTIQENRDATGAWVPGQFVITVDDGSGVPSTTLLDTVHAAVEAVRPIGSIYAVRPPNVISTSISLAISVASPTQRAAAAAAVGAAVQGFVDALPIGASLPLTRIPQLAYAAHPSVTNVTEVALNGGTADVAASLSDVIKAASVSVN
jgi:uncharacterized phage protein gp47/JayE